MIADTKLLAGRLNRSWRRDGASACTLEACDRAGGCKSGELGELGNGKQVRRAKSPVLHEPSPTAATPASEAIAPLEDRVRAGESVDPATGLLDIGRRHGEPDDAFP
jgi:hypothetical protein